MLLFTPGSVRVLISRNPLEEADGDVDENALLGSRKKQKTTYQERVEQNRVCLIV